MSSEGFSIELAGHPRFFKFTIAERKELERRFGMGLKDFLSKNVFPTDEQGKATGGGLWESQIAFLFTGLKHALGPKDKSEGKVETWVQEWIEAGTEAEPHHIITLLYPGLLACLSSGVLGQKIELSGPEEEPETGKAEPSQPPS